MTTLNKVIFLSFCFLANPIVQGKELLNTTTAWDGGKIIYPQGDAQITAHKLEIEAGEETKFHCHPVPTFGYIIKGTVEVETKDGKIKIFKEGESIVEVLRTVHRGKAIDGPVELIVFYAGATDIPNTVLAENDKEHVYCNK